MGPRAGLDGCGKSRPPSGFDPRTLQLVASSRTVYGVPSHTVELPENIGGFFFGLQTERLACNSSNTRQQIYVNSTLIYRKQQSY